MPFWKAITFGALGGLIVEFVCVWGYIISWQAARRECMESDIIPLPGIAKYIDLPADTLVTVTRVLMGAGMGCIWGNQVAGPMAAISVGAAAPALFRQLNGARTLDDLRDSAKGKRVDSRSNITDSIDSIEREFGRGVDRNRGVGDEVPNGR